MKTTNKGMISFFVSDKEGHPMLSFVEQLNILRIPTEFNQNWGSLRMQDGALHSFLISLRVYRSAPRTVFPHCWQKKAELENISYYLQIGGRNEVFWFSQPAQWPRDAWRNNSAEIRGFPSDLCGPKFFAKESRAELQRFPWVSWTPGSCWPQFLGPELKKKNISLLRCVIDVLGTI